MLWVIPLWRSTQKNPKQEKRAIINNNLVPVKVTTYTYTTVTGLVVATTLQMGLVAVVQQDDAIGHSSIEDISHGLGQVALLAL